jgi:hypothetical protein
LANTVGLTDPADPWRAGLGGFAARRGLYAGGERDGRER